MLLNHVDRSGWPKGGQQRVTAKEFSERPDTKLTGEAFVIPAFRIPKKGVGPTKVPVLRPEHISTFKTPTHAPCGDVESVIERACEAERRTHHGRSPCGIKLVIAANRSSPTLSGCERGRDIYPLRRHSTSMEGGE